MNRIVTRLLLLILHAFVNVMLVAFITDHMDISASWLSMFFFIIIIALLFGLFIKHLLSFISLLKTRS